jgi:hypothetical protein
MTKVVPRFRVFGTYVGEETFSQSMTKVVPRFRVFGTYVGEERAGGPKKGERFASAAIAIYRFVDEKIVDDWGVQELALTDAP